MGVDRVQAQLQGVAELVGETPTEERGVVGAEYFLIFGRRAAWIAQARVDERPFVAVGGEVELHAVHARLGKDHRRNHRAHLRAGRQGVEVLAFGV